MTGALIIAGGILAALVILWWLADHERGMRWTRNAVRRSFPDVPSISPCDLMAWLNEESGNTPQLLDVREPDEHAVSHLHGAKLVSPDAEAKDVLHGIDTSQPVIVYCAGGYRAARLGRRLIEAGCRDVRNLDGGIFAWANEGLPVERNGVTVTQVHPVSRWFRRLLKQSSD